MDPRRLRDKPQAPIFTESLAQFGRELSNFFFDRDYVPAFMLKADDDISDIAKFKDHEKFAIPCWTYRVDSLTPNRDRFNRTSLRRQGVILEDIVKTPEGQRPDDPNRFYHTYHLTPVDITIDVAFYCAYDELYEFGPLWQQAAQSRYLDFQLEVGESKKPILIKNTLSEDITFSGLTLDDVQYNQFTSTVVMSTYHGVVSDIKQIASYRMSTQVIENKAPEGNTTSTSMEITKRKDTTVFIKRPKEGNSG